LYKSGKKERAWKPLFGRPAPKVLTNRGGEAILEQTQGGDKGEFILRDLRGETGRQKKAPKPGLLDIVLQNDRDQSSSAKGGCSHVLGE